MVDFLNMTTTADPSIFWQAYCLNPPDEDNCPFGYCPNLDVAGKLFCVIRTIKLSFTLNMYGDKGPLVRMAGIIHSFLCHER